MLQTPNKITVHGSYPFAGAASCDPVRMLIEKQAPDGKGAGKKGPPPPPRPPGPPMGPPPLAHPKAPHDREGEQVWPFSGRPGSKTDDRAATAAAEAAGNAADLAASTKAAGTGEPPRPPPAGRHGLHRSCI